MLSWEFQNQLLSLSGCLDKNTSMTFWQQRNSFILANDPVLAVDLSGLTRIDSAGLATLLAIYRKLKQHNKGFIIRGVSQQILDLAKVNGVLELLPIK